MVKATMLSSMAAADEPITTSQARFAKWVAANREALESSNVFFEKFGLPLQAASHSELAGEIVLGSATALPGRFLPPDEPTVVVVVETWARASAEGGLLGRWSIGSAAWRRARGRRAKR